MRSRLFVFGGAALLYSIAAQGQNLVAPHPCSKLPTMRSAAGTAPATLTITNVSPHDVTVWWVSPGGAPEFMASIDAGQYIRLDGHQGSVFVVYGPGGGCVGAYVTTLKEGKVRLSAALFPPNTAKAPQLPARRSAGNGSSPPAAGSASAVQRAEVAGSRKDITERTAKAYTDEELRQAKRLSFSLGYEVVAIESDPFDRGKEGRARQVAARIDRLQPRPPLQQATAAWVNTMETAPLDVFGPAVQLRKAFFAHTNTLGPPEDVYANFGAVAFFLQEHFALGAAAAGQDLLNRATGDPLQRDEANARRGLAGRHARHRATVPRASQ